MNPNPFNFNRETVSTPSGVISYVEHGAGPVALFIHGGLLKPEQDVSVTANARMVAQLIDALRIDQVDLVGNCSGGGIA